MKEPTQTLLEPGTYEVEVTLRNRVKVEVGQKFTESDAIDEVLNDPGAELVDYEIL